MRANLFLVAAAPLALALTACDSGTVVEDPSDPEQIAEAMGDLPTPQAGEYSVTGELIEFDIPGLGEDEAGMMRGLFEGSLASAQTFCMTEEMIGEGGQDWITKSQNVPEGCEFTSYETTANSFDAEMTCSAEGNEGTVKIAGTVSSTTQDMRMEMDMANPMLGDGTMRMVLETQSQRVGDCAS